ncbi:Multidrug resistance protein MdtN [Thalassovita gelatinovora]|uniref:Multidrug resistance protein MdtN n=1 Tax=Thalassovita gelatinovora TaxID=53501 RepID=A0A0P1FIQ8_THAGE|nr:HlyD family efflux transporter periplasmic adaptor subunit [Thalassovita gelatinovora]QIZ82192.1 HlyD family efflux transporter periplasmic adaptor subunit [Thalassovita gelatinovora]CUH67821.1 Multidrug resistance protein MdtN [Thalassovita gelatinovora]SEP66671.1 HlyD family secretion protein [Thalassovita gelatinovora]
MSFVCAIPLLSTLFAQCAPVLPLATGYVEAEHVLIAPVATARIEEMTLSRGDAIAKGDILVRLERGDATIALAEAEAALRAAEARQANLGEGRRAEEISVIEANLASARAQAQEIARETARVSSLVERGVAPQAQLDEAQSRLDVANSHVIEVEANLAVARLPARSYEIAAAQADVAQAEARVAAAEWQLSRRTLYAPADGRVTEILRNEGEIAGPQAPVLSLLPDGTVFIRLYVPETAIAAINIGTRLRINCDGCGEGAEATVSYIAEEPEFTPPVIYSIENRQKLVFMVEARPDKSDKRLKPGQIVDAILPEPAQ